MPAVDPLSYDVQWRWRLLAQRNDGLLRATTAAWSAFVLAHVQIGDEATRAAAINEARATYATARALQLAAESDLITFIKAALPNG